MTPVTEQLGEQQDSEVSELTLARKQACFDSAAKAIVDAVTEFPDIVQDGLRKCGSTFINKTLDSIPENLR